MFRRFGILATVLAASLTAPMAGAQDIGVVATLDPNLQGTPPGGSTRALSLGNKVFQNEEIVSTATGRGQLMFIDETTLSIAPNSRVVLDSFVYDPAKQDGSFSLRLTQGALRFIGGKTTNNRAGVIRTPSATIGIRGSTVLVSHINGKTTAVFMMGDRMCVQSGGGQSCTSRRGAVLGEDGYRGVISQASLSQLLTAIDGPPATTLTRRETPKSGTAEAAPAGSDPVSTRGTRRNFAALDREGRTASGLGVFPRVTSSGFVFAPGGVRPEGAVGCPSQGKGGTGTGTGIGNGGGRGLSCGLGSVRGQGRGRGIGGKGGGKP